MERSDSSMSPTTIITTLSALASLAPLRSSQAMIDEENLVSQRKLSNLASALLARPPPPPPHNSPAITPNSDCVDHVLSQLSTSLDECASLKAHAAAASVMFSHQLRVMERKYEDLEARHFDLLSTRNATILKKSSSDEVDFFSEVSAGGATTTFYFLESGKEHCQSYLLKIKGGEKHMLVSYKKTVYVSCSSWTSFGLASSFVRSGRHEHPAKAATGRDRREDEGDP